MSDSLQLVLVGSPGTGRPRAWPDQGAGCLSFPAPKGAASGPGGASLLKRGPLGILGEFYSFS